MIDFIGDIHGHADKLETLLRKLGYEQNNGSYSHSERKALFVGDYIDRGPKIKKTLSIVRAMVENDKAIALMGNHEYNALCFHYQEMEGGHLRKHEIKNIIQHYKTLKEFQNRQAEYEDYLNWFKTLPLFYEQENFRAVHACWDNKHISVLRESLINNRLTDELIYKSVIKGTPLNLAIEETLKGKEIKLPNGFVFKDTDGTERDKIRIKWWEDPNVSTYDELCITPIESLPGGPIEKASLDEFSYYSENNKPVFFGHYWLEGNPSLFRNNICCLDYSIAKQGFLASYRLDKENKLDDNNFVYV